MGNTGNTPSAQVPYAPQPSMQYASPANMGGLQTIAPAQNTASFVNANPAMGQLTSSFQVGTTAPVVAQPGQPIRFLDGMYASQHSRAAIPFSLTKTLCPCWLTHQLTPDSYCASPPTTNARAPRTTIRTVHRSHASATPA